ncbi:hypothetical protein ACFQBY_00510 [Promicromonospora citrea]|uniref:hypothetical protein n=1 Tax=Promicromonospora citrea TaxID=43677 RepID=UPI003615EFC8
MALLEAGEHVTGGSYVVERLLGRGSFSEVYRVRHTVLGRLAMKVLRKVGTLDRTHELLGRPCSCRGSATRTWCASSTPGR